MFRLICLNNVIKTDIYTKNIFCPFCKSAEGSQNVFIPLRKPQEGLKIQKSAITAQIQDADRARDEIYAGMVETSNAALKHFSEEVRGAAARLKILFDTYGDVNRKSLSEQTSATYNILQE